jgi:hypothetical protein
MSVEQAIAADLLERLEAEVGHPPEIHWVDFYDNEGYEVDCVDRTQHGDLWAVIYYDGDDEDCESTWLSFQRPEIVLNCANIAQEMCRVPIDRDALAREILRAADRMGEEES